MPTLPQASIRRLALLRRAPFWAQALAVCALFAIASVAVLDDYGVAADEPTQRGIAISNADYIATGSAEELYKADFRYFGIAFEMPLLLAERALGLQAPHIYLTRHLLTHLLFIAGGFACGMLAYRMTGGRWVALLAMLMFLLHPRLYAHSFFNTKDIPFAALLIIALYLAHRAFRKDAIGAFLLCGVGVGLAIDLRPFALMLPPMILAMRALDLWQAGRAKRKRILLASAAFLAATLATIYIVHPHYWENPLRFIESVGVMSQHPIMLRVPNLFMGEIYMSDAVPWNYIPAWFSITSPPVALALGAIGCAAVCWQAITRPLAALLDREIRFRILTLACFALPVAVVIALQSNIYNDWRYMYFLWAPLCLLAAVGLHKITNIRMGGGIWKFGARLPRRASGGLMPTLTYGATAVGLITTLTAMAALHPHQQVYFNALADTRTPGALAERYDMDYWQVAQRQSLEYLLARYPDRDLRVYPKSFSMRILPINDRNRIAPSLPHEADFYIKRSLNRWNGTDEPAIHGVRAYGSGITYILAPNSAAYRDYYRAAYSDVEANGTLLARADFDVYVHNGALYYLNANCAPLRAGVDLAVFLHITPADPADLPADRRELGFDNRDFRISRKRVGESVFAPTVFFEDKCVIRHPMPDYPIARISTGHFVIGGDAAWRADIDFAAHAAARALYDSIAAGDYGAPVAQSHFDLYLSGNALTYIKESCAADDTDARFFLHIIPSDPADLPADERERGFANMDFRFADHGARIGDICVAERELPGYAIERIRTGQFVSGKSAVWRAEFPVAR